jgi:hypothetical protein
METQSVPPGGSLVAVRQSSEGRCQLLRFRTREASDLVFVLDDEREDQSWDELHECAEATVGSLRSSLEVFCRDIPKILQVRFQAYLFSSVTEAFFVMPRFLPSGSDGSERRQVVVHPPRGRRLGLVAIPEDLARRGYCAPFSAGCRGSGPPVALNRPESRGGSGARGGGRGARRSATAAVGVRPGRRGAGPISGPGCRGRKPGRNPCGRPSRSPGHGLGAACPSRRYALAILGSRSCLFPLLVFEIFLLAIRRARVRP